MLTLNDHIMFMVLAALFPLWALLFGMRRLKRAEPDQLPGVRLWLYRRAIVIQWALVAVVATLWIRHHRAWAALGLVPRLTPGLIGVMVGLAIAVIAVVRQRNAALADPETVDRVRRRLGRLELMLPHSPKELRWFIVLSITAGLCEEVLYRGYLIWYLAHGMGLLPAAGLAAMFFGLGHSYQGLRGVLLTSAVGVFLGAVFLLTGSLFAGMIFHGLMDVHSGHLGYAVLTRAPVEPDVEFPESDAFEPAADPDHQDAGLGVSESLRDPRA